jgi:hypothetical protein
VIRLTLPSGRSIRIVTAPVVLATKLEAFRGRGRGDDLISHDLAAQFRELLNTSAFLEALPAFLPPDQASQQRLPDVLEILRAITALAEP